MGGVLGVSIFLTVSKVIIHSHYYNITILSQISRETGESFHTVPKLLSMFSPHLERVMFS